MTTPGPAPGVVRPPIGMSNPAEPDRPVKLVLIAAVARGGAIGRGNGLLFTDPADQRHFRAATLGHPVLMGRRTWQSLPERFRPLPGRRNLVLSREPGFTAPGAEVLPDLATALALLKGAPRAAPVARPAPGGGAGSPAKPDLRESEPVVFVIGGADLYAQALPLADELLLTEVDRDYADADAFFPAWDRGDFDEVRRETHRAADGTPFAIVSYRRRTRPPAVG